MVNTQPLIVAIHGYESTPMESVWNTALQVGADHVNMAVTRGYTGYRHTVNRSRKSVLVTPLSVRQDTPVGSHRNGCRAVIINSITMFFFVTIEDLRS